MKFVADGMLGKLTRWLRMLGYDVKYSSEFDDEQLMAIVKDEGRILLTRDLALFQRATAKGAKALYLSEEGEAERLAKLALKFGVKLDIDMAESRCPKCNTKVKLVPKDKVVSRVKRNTFLRYNEFWECPRCGQVYWQGAHWVKIRKTLESARGALKEMRVAMRERLTDALPRTA